MKRSAVHLTMLLVLVAGCGSSDESEFESNRCFTDEVGCGRTHCTMRETCELDPACPSCETVCTLLDVTVSTAPASEAQSKSMPTGQ